VKSIPNKLYRSFPTQNYGVRQLPSEFTAILGRRRWYQKHEMQKSWRAQAVMLTVAERATGCMHGEREN